jgi:Fe-S-cluster containining protein
MKLDFSEFFAQYEALVAEVDSVFDRVADMHGDCISCKTGCSDCCHALFDVSLIEALYLNHKFLERYPFGEERSNIVEAANIADRKIYKRKRQLYRDSMKGVETRELLEAMAKERIRCPLLNSEEKCTLYDARPITCRLYGIPTNIGGKAHTCGLSKFKPGTPYPTVSLDTIQDRLGKISLELCKSIKSRYKALPEVLVPVSMALITNYDDEYLGLKEPKKKGV